MINWIKRVLEVHTNELPDRTWPQTRLKNGAWVDARPVPGPFTWELERKIKDIVLILAGKARAVRWY